MERQAEGKAANQGSCDRRGMIRKKQPDFRSGRQPTPQRIQRGDRRASGWPAVAAAFVSVG